MRINKNIFKATSILLILFSGAVMAEAIKCYTKNEVGEMSIGNKYIFERTNDLNKSKPSKMDFDLLTITNADTGKVTNLTKKADNYFMSNNSHFITNNEKTVVVEMTFSKYSDMDLVYSKILMCEK